MKRGFVFTLVFSLFFLMLLYSAASYLGMLEKRTATLSQKDASRDMYVVDDVGNDYLDIWGMKASLTRANDRLYFSIADRIPNRIDNVEGALSSYESFLPGEYSKHNNIKASANLDRSGEIFLSQNKLSYKHSSRSDIVIEGPAQEYKIKVKLDRPCTSCSAVGFWSWGGAGSGPFVTLEIYANGTKVDTFSQSSGYLAINSTNSFQVALENGAYFELSLSPSQTRMLFSNVAGETLTTLGVGSSEEAIVYAPVRLVLGDRVFDRIALIQK
jgi:hypothetical protein